MWWSVGFGVRRPEPTGSLGVGGGERHAGEGTDVGVGVVQGGLKSRTDLRAARQPPHARALFSASMV